MRKHIIAIILMMVLLAGGILPGFNTDASAASGEEFINYARNYMGTPYVDYGRSPSASEDHVS